MSQSVPEPADQTMKIDVPAERSFASGSYVVRQVLPEGGQKTVYLVRDTELERECVLALSRANLLEADDRERFRREARAMARLDHPNIVSVYEVGEEEGRPFFVCQYVAGGDLRGELRAAGGPLTMERALKSRRWRSSAQWYNRSSFASNGGSDALDRAVSTFGRTVHRHRVRREEHDRQDRHADRPG